jgi:hypothetical protein
MNCQSQTYVNVCGVLVLVRKLIRDKTLVAMLVRMLVRVLVGVLVGVLVRMLVRVLVRMLVGVLLRSLYWARSLKRLVPQCCVGSGVGGVLSR